MYIRVKGSSIIVADNISAHGIYLTIRVKGPIVADNIYIYTIMMITAYNIASKGHYY